MQESFVQKCEVESCCYNKEGMCHARSITIGDGSNPKCDTYTHCSGSSKGGDAQCASVGACKVTACKFNEDMECQAADIIVGMNDNEPDCLTFKSR